MSLILVNKENILSSLDLPKELVQDLATSIWLEKETCEAFYKMNTGIQKAGFSSLILMSGYRSFFYQQKIFNKKVEMFIKQGLDQASASQEASTIVAQPGTSEHQTGLAIDITNDDLINQEDPLIETFGETDHGKWLLSYAHEYGFILRYPKNKTHITHISYEPWHYRYVGCEHAGKMKTAGMCLEEYITCLDDN